MDGLNFSIAQHRLNKNKLNNKQLVKEVAGIPANQRRCQDVKRRTFKNIELIHDLVRDDMRKWLQGLSDQNLRYLLSQHGAGESSGDWQQSHGSTRDKLIRLVIKVCVASDEVEEILVKFHNNKPDLRGEMDAAGIHIDPKKDRNQTMVSMANLLVNKRGQERDVIALPELQQPTNRAPDTSFTQPVSATPSATAQTQPDQTASTGPAQLTPACAPTKTRRGEDLTFARTPISTAAPVQKITPASTASPTRPIFLALNAALARPTRLASAPARLG